jgi:hypothetical protein
MPNGRAFSGEPSEQSERPERQRGRRVRCNAMLGGPQISSHGCNRHLRGIEAAILSHRHTISVDDGRLGRELSGDDPLTAKDR